MYNPYSGITTNQSEGFNTVLKRLQLWREVPLDSIVLSLYHLQAFYYNEIQRGICQMGNYSLQPQFARLARSPDEVKSLVCIAPEDIVDRVRSGASQSKQEVPLAPPAPNPPPPTSQLARAKLVVEQDRISYDVKLGTFVVVSSEGNPSVVKLFPSETCSCPSTVQCYHILAAKLSLGIGTDKSKSRINLTQLRRNTRSRQDKKSGRKRPRPGDCDVIPAPDAEIQEQTQKQTQKQTEPNSLRSKPENKTPKRCKSAAATRSQQMRRNIAPEKTVQEDAQIISSGDEDAEDDDSTWLSIRGVKLTTDDERTLGEGKWLNDKIIHAAQLLIKNDNDLLPVGGLQDPILGQTLTFDIESGEMVQILNSGGNHWIAISTIEAKPQSVSTQEHDNVKRRVRVYDSLYRDMPFETKDQIAALLQCKDKSIILEYANVQVSYSYLCLCY